MADKAITIETAGSDPTYLVPGQVWFRKDISKFKIYDGENIITISPETMDCIKSLSTTHSYEGGSNGANSIDGNVDTAQSASYSGGDGGGGCYCKSTHIFNKPKNITEIRYKLYARAHDDGRYARDRSISLGVYYWTVDSNDWILVPGTYISNSGGGDGDSTGSSGYVSMKVDLKNITKIEARANAGSSAAGGEGHYNGETHIYEIQAFGL